MPAWFSQLHPVGQALLAGVFTWAVAACGAALALFLRSINRKLLDSMLMPKSPEHSMLDLGALVRVELIRAGVRPADVGTFPDACTCCDPERFHSYRRDGSDAGRLLHWIAAREI